MSNRSRQPTPLYSEEQTTKWLAWLARGMQQHGQTVFLVEQLQPSWLATGGRRVVYVLASRLISGLFLGLLLGLIPALVLLFGTTAGLIGALISALIFGVFFGAFLGLSSMLISGLFLGVRSIRQTLKSDIQTVETLRWSWVHAAKAASIPVLFSVLYSRLKNDLANELDFSVYLSLGLLAGLLLSLLAGFRRGFVEMKTIPNQGIRLSIRNAVLAGGMAGLICGLFFGLFIGWTEPLATTLAVGLIVGLITGSMSAFWYGGMDVIHHYLLRFILARKGYLPWKLVPFLDYAADNLHFLQKVGGGYVFIHRYLLEHFAAMGEDRAEGAVVAVPAESPRPRVSSSPDPESAVRLRAPTQ